MRLYPHIKSMSDFKGCYGPVNSFLNSLFSQVTVKVGTNQECIGDANSYHPWRAYLDMLLSTTKEQQDTLLWGMQLWSLDTAGKFNDCAVASANVGATKRRTKVEESKTVDIAGQLVSDLFRQTKYLPSNTPVRIELNRSPNAFYTLSAATPALDKACDGTTNPNVEWFYRFEITDLWFYGYYVQINAAQVLAHEKELMHEPMSFPLNNVKMTSYRIPKNSQIFTEPNIVNGVLPQRATFFMVQEKATIGDSKLNPFYFEHNNLANITLTVNGVEMPFSSSVDMPTTTTVLPYMSLHNAISPLFQPEAAAPVITKEMFDGGYAIYPITLAPDVQCGHTAPPRMGSGTLKLRFATPPSEDLVLFMYAEYPATMLLNSTRSAQFVLGR